MKRSISLAATALVAAASVSFGVPSAHAVELPEDCAVPPDLLPPDINIVIGTDASETLRGTAGADYVCGLQGNDRIITYGGDDFVAGDTTTFFGDFEAEGGNDRINAGAGDDEVLAGPGDDSVNGGSGDDFLALALGDDRGRGGPGADEVIGGYGRDITLGNGGPDVVAGGPDNDLVNGGAGDDQLFGGVPRPPGPPPGTDRCIGAGGTDTAVECAVLRGVEGP